MRVTLLNFHLPEIGHLITLFITLFTSFFKLGMKLCIADLFPVGHRPPMILPRDPTLDRRPILEASDPQK